MQLIVYTLDVAMAVATSQGRGWPWLEFPTHHRLTLHWTEHSRSPGDVSSTFANANIASSLRGMHVLTTSWFILPGAILSVANNVAPKWFSGHYSFLLTPWVVNFFFPLFEFQKTAGGSKNGKFADIFQIIYPSISTIRLQSHSIRIEKVQQRKVPALVHQRAARPSSAKLLFGRRQQIRRISFLLTVKRINETEWREFWWKAAYSQRPLDSGCTPTYVMYSDGSYGKVTSQS